MAESESSESLSDGEKIRGGRSGAVALGLFVAGLSVAHFGILPPLAGFGILALSIPVALFAFVASVARLIRSRTLSAEQRSTTRIRAASGLVDALIVLIFVGVGASAGMGLPRINDITTDLDDPPVFIHAGTLGANQGRDMAYPGESFARQQLRGYPDLGNLVLDEAPPRAFAAVRSALVSLDDTEITFEDPNSGHIEATTTSFAFRFVDDVVVRLREVSGGTKIDIRSKSRDGKGDMGANAARIREIFAALG